MTLSKEELFNEAINLSPMDKAKLVELILSSFNFHVLHSRYQIRRVRLRSSTAGDDELDQALDPRPQPADDGMSQLVS